MKYFIYATRLFVLCAYIFVGIQALHMLTGGTIASSTTFSRDVYGSVPLKVETAQSKVVEEAPSCDLLLNVRNSDNYRVRSDYATLQDDILLDEVVEVLIGSGENCETVQTLAYIIAAETTGGRNIEGMYSYAYGWYQFMPSTWEDLTNRGICFGDIRSMVDQTECAITLVKRGEAYNRWYRWWT